jgi:hypothetical protein
VCIPVHIVEEAEWSWRSLWINMVKRKIFCPIWVPTLDRLSCNESVYRLCYSLWFTVKVVLWKCDLPLSVDESNFYRISVGLI